MLLVPQSKSSRPSTHARGTAYTVIDGEPYVSIRDVDRLPPFLMNVVGNGDVWLFVGSNGGVTAGRRDPDLAIFPYRTVDKILAVPEASGPVCLIEADGVTWEPGRGTAAAGTRHLHKHVCGTSVVFEETHEPLGLRFRWLLATSDEFGVVRQCRLENVGRRPVSIRMLDGWHHMLPPGVGQHTYEHYSYLAAAYVRHEFLADSGLLVTCLNAAISDRPQPAESLRAAVAWSFGHRVPRRSHVERSIDRFRSGEESPKEDAIVRGEFGCRLVEDSATLTPGESCEWFSVVDTGLDHAAVVALHERLRHGASLRDEVLDALKAEAAGIRRRVAAADGLQASADRTVAAHHLSNTLFNIMRGGIPVAGHTCPGDDVARFVAARNAPVHAAHADWLGSLGDLDIDALMAAAEKRGDPQLLRILREYLPVCFSRRHGDPSRPWNRFSLPARGRDGREPLAYAGNWRDIFQNWEALAWSHPGCLPAMIAVFLNATTADGYNPYRITRDGIDWEVENPNDPWSHIGYWGDHQIVYLSRLLELHERFRPGELARSLGAPSHASADVPYRIKGFDDLLCDPRHSIVFDADADRRLRRRMEEVGGDGAAVTGSDGQPRLYTLAEKLLVPALVKLTNLVPGGGIWLNTQRPEWNDANNALAGWGLSVVTVCYLRRHLVLLEQLVAAHGQDLVLTRPAADLLAEVSAAVAGAAAADPYVTFEALGRAGQRHRDAVYAGGSPETTTMALAEVVEMVRRGRAVVDATIEANRRADGMFHAYNRLSVRDRTVEVHHLDLMLEGQVSVLASGLLSDDDAIALLSSLRASPLFRADQKSYLLQPDRELHPFLDRNVLPSDWQTRCPEVARRVAEGTSRVIVVDAQGEAHFHADLTNEQDLAAMLRSEGYPEAGQAALRDVWEEVFQHASFTGRSGSFFAFEGLGSIYWHMVAKLLLAVQECHARATEAARPRLRAAYMAIRDGLGFRKSPEEYGAFPTDAYSHTPRHLGAQQPGMTGQVKEEILTRLGELGVSVEAGRVRFAPTLLDDSEFGAAERFEIVGADGGERTIRVPDGGLGFTLCQVPVLYVPCGEASIEVARSDGGVEAYAGDSLPADRSADLFSRNGRIASIRVGVVRHGQEVSR
jgi:hypothetical protein